MHKPWIRKSKRVLTEEGRRLDRLKRGGPKAKREYEREEEEKLKPAVKKVLRLDRRYKLRAKVEKK